MIKDHFSNIFKRPLEKGIIIAEVGVNHEGDLDKAIDMIDQVKDSGGDAVKFQSYKAKLLARKDSKAYWDTSKENTKSTAGHHHRAHRAQPGRGDIFIMMAALR